MDDPATHAFLWPPAGREDLFRRMAAMVGQWSLFGIGGWMVAERGGGRLVGTVALFHAMRGLGFDSAAEMGWIFCPDVHGQGVAREACEAALAWHDRDAGRNGDVWAMIAPANAPSVRLAGRLGFVRHAARDYHGEPVDLYRRPAR